MGDTQADRTLWVGNLDSRVTEELLYELFLQAGPLATVKRPSEKNYAFVEFKHDQSVPYSVHLMNTLILFDRPLKLQFRSGSKHDPNSNSGNNSPTVSGGPMMPGGPMMSGGMMPNNGPNMVGGLITPPPLQRSLSIPYAGPFPHQMPNQFNKPVSFPGMNSGYQRQQSTPNISRDRSRDRHHGDSSGHHSGRPYEQHMSRDRSRRESDLRSHSPPLGQSPEMSSRDQRKGSFLRKDGSPYQHGRQDEGRLDGGRQHMERGGRSQNDNKHGHNSRGDRSDRHRDRSDGEERGRYRDDSRERHRGRYR